MGILNFIKKVCVQDAVYWGKPTPDGYGSFTFPDPVQIKVRWDEKTTKILDDKGIEMLSKVTVLCPDELQLEGMLMLGTLLDVIVPVPTPTPTPTPEPIIIYDIEFYAPQAASFILFGDQMNEFPAGEDVYFYDDDTFLGQRKVVSGLEVDGYTHIVHDGEAIDGTPNRLSVNGLIPVPTPTPEIVWKSPYDVNVLEIKAWEIKTRTVTPLFKSTDKFVYSYYLTNKSNM